MIYYNMILYDIIGDGLLFQEGAGQERSAREGAGWAQLILYIYIYMYDYMIYIII